jgi:hypothetical protein
MKPHDVSHATVGAKLKQSPLAVLKKVVISLVGRKRELTLKPVYLH